MVVCQVIQTLHSLLSQAIIQAVKKIPISWDKVKENMPYQTLFPLEWPREWIFTQIQPQNLNEGRIDGTKVGKDRNN